MGDRTSAGSTDAIMHAFESLLSSQPGCQLTHGQKETSRVTRSAIDIPRTGLREYKRIVTRPAPRATKIASLMPEKKLAALATQKVTPTILTARGYRTASLWSGLGERWATPKFDAINEPIRLEASCTRATKQARADKARCCRQTLCESSFSLG